MQNEVVFSQCLADFTNQQNRAQPVPLSHRSELGYQSSNPNPAWPHPRPIAQAVVKKFHLEYILEVSVDVLELIDCFSRCRVVLKGILKLVLFDLLLSLLGCAQSTAFRTTAELLTTGSKAPTTNGCIRSASGDFNVTSMLGADFVVVCLVFVLEFNHVGSTS
jgi:hypothetical protein